MSPSMLKEHGGNGICCRLACSKTKKQLTNDLNIVCACMYVCIHVEREMCPYFHPLFYILLKIRLTRFIAVWKIFCINIIKSYLVYLCFWTQLWHFIMHHYHHHWMVTMPVYILEVPGSVLFQHMLTMVFLNVFRPLFLKLPALYFDDRTPLSRQFSVTVLNPMLS
jgi:hypothetical protein